jgi:hypothetical protein
MNSLSLKHYAILINTCSSLYAYEVSYKEENHQYTALIKRYTVSRTEPINHKLIRGKKALIVAEKYFNNRVISGTYVVEITEITEYETPLLSLIHLNALIKEMTMFDGRRCGKNTVLFFGILEGATEITNNEHPTTD